MCCLQHGLAPENLAARLRHTNMLETLHGLSDWLLGFADSDWAVLVLGLSSFFESIFFPIPPDPLLLGVAVVQQHLAVWLGVLVALSSVAGAVVGHWIGKRFGRPLLHRMFPEGKVDQVERLFDKYGAWATLLAAFTPIPYKVFAITAGVVDLDRRTFIVASLVGRGGRFITQGVLIFIFGESIKAFISDNFELLTVAVSAALLGAVLVWAVFRRRRRARAAVP